MSRSSSVLGRGQLGEDFGDGVGLVVELGLVVEPGLAVEALLVVWLGLVVELGLRLD